MPTFPKITKILKYQPSVGFEEGLRRTVEYFKKAFAKTKMEYFKIKIKGILIPRSVFIALTGLYMAGLLFSSSRLALKVPWIGGQGDGADL